MVDKNIEKANEIIDKHAEFTDHYADQEYTKEGILKMMEEYAPYTEPVSEEEIDYAAHEAASKIGANTSSNESKYFKKGAKWLQQRQVIDKCDCPLCGSDDMFSFQQTCHKCRSCDYRFTK